MDNAGFTSSTVVRVMFGFRVEGSGFRGKGPKDPITRIIFGRVYVVICRGDGFGLRVESVGL